MPTSFPGALDTLPRPGPTTEMDDAGFEGDVVIDNISDAIEAVQAKLGIGASTAVAGRVLRATGTGASAWGQIQTADIGADQVTVSHLAANSVGLAELIDGNVTTAKLAANAITQSGFAQHSSTTTNSTTFVDVDATNASVTLTTTGGDILIWFFGVVVQSAGADIVDAYFAIRQDSGADNELTSANISALQGRVPFGGVFRYGAPSAGSHTYRVRFRSADAAKTIMAIGVRLLVVELKR